MLAASLPADFLAEHAGIDIGAGRVAVFTTCTPGTYFLDEITYHGDPAELALLRRGSTQVLVQGALELPAHGIHAQAGGDDALSFIGGEPQWLQNEDLELDGLAFALQIDGRRPAQAAARPVLSGRWRGLPVPAHAGRRRHRPQWRFSCR